MMKLSPITPRNSMPGRPRNKSVCNSRRVSITVLVGAGPKDFPVVRSKKSKLMSAPAASGEGPVVTVNNGLSWLKAMKSGTSPGRSRNAFSTI